MEKCYLIMIKNFLCSLILMILTARSLLGSIDQSLETTQPITRAAFDLGSGTFKLAVADVIEHHVQLKFSKVITVGLGLDLAESSNGLLSEKVQNVALNALTELLNEAKAHGATQFAGIATAAFRHAANGKELLQKLKNETGIHLRLIAQEEEGILAFKTFLNVFPEVKEEHCIALDLGAASFQLTAQNQEFYDVFHGPIGVSGVLKLFSEQIRHTPYKRGLLFIPITLDEILLLIEKVKNKLILPSWLRNKLSHEFAEVCFLDDWIDEIQYRTGQELMVSKIQIWKALLNILLDPSDLTPYQRKQSYIISYVLLYAVMDKLQINELKMKLQNTGSTLGIMTESHFWP